MQELQAGGQIIPTVVYDDGTHEVNPSDEALARRIGLTTGSTYRRLEVPGVEDLIGAGDVRAGSTKQLGSAVGTVSPLS